MATFTKISDRENFEESFKTKFRGDGGIFKRYLKLAFLPPDERAKKIEDIKDGFTFETFLDVYLNNHDFYRNFLKNPEGSPELYDEVFDREVARIEKHNEKIKYEELKKMRKQNLKFVQTIQRIEEPVDNDVDDVDDDRVESAWLTEHLKRLKRRRAALVSGKLLELPDYGDEMFDPIRIYTSKRRYHNNRFNEVRSEFSEELTNSYKNYYENKPEIPNDNFQFDDNPEKSEIDSQEVWNKFSDFSTQRIMRTNLILHDNGRTTFQMFKTEPKYKMSFSSSMALYYDKRHELMQSIYRDPDDDPEYHTMRVRSYWREPDQLKEVPKRPFKVELAYLENLIQVADLDEFLKFALKTQNSSNDIIDVVLNVRLENPKKDKSWFQYDIVDIAKSNRLIATNWLHAKLSLKNDLESLHPKYVKCCMIEIIKHYLTEETLTSLKNAKMWQQCSSFYSLISPEYNMPNSEIPKISSFCVYCGVVGDVLVMPCAHTICEKCYTSDKKNLCWCGEKFKFDHITTHDEFNKIIQAVNVATPPQLKPLDVCSDDFLVDSLKSIGDKFGLVRMLFKKNTTMDETLDDQQTDIVQKTIAHISGDLIPPIDRYLYMMHFNKN